MYLCRIPTMKSNSYFEVHIKSEKSGSEAVWKGLKKK